MGRIQLIDASPFAASWALDDNTEAEDKLEEFL
jgi:hypothetical protein